MAYKRGQQSKHYLKGRQPVGNCTASQHCLRYYHLTIFSPNQVCQDMHLSQESVVDSPLSIEPQNRGVYLHGFQCLPLGLL